MSAQDGSQFRGTWTLIAGNPIGEEIEMDRYDLRIVDAEVGEAGRYDLFCDYWAFGRGEGTPAELFLQELQYDPETGTLDDLGGANDPERRISFWDRHARRGNEKRSIFAMRVGAVSNADGALPLFEQGGTGSWGAEDGGGKEPVDRGRGSR